jgi:hypothetical protein
MTPERIKLWVQTFADVFSSASREHVQGGRMSLLNKLAGISSIVIGVWQVVFLSNILLNEPTIGLSNLQIIFHVLLLMMVFVVLLVRPAKERSLTWWFTVFAFALLVPLNLIAYFAPNIPDSPVFEWIMQNSMYFLMACMCLNFVRFDQNRFVFRPEFWGLVVLNLSLAVRLFWISPSFYGPLSDRWDIILCTVAFVAGWLVLGFALWSRASTPQPRALT